MTKYEKLEDKLDNALLNTIKNRPYSLSPKSELKVGRESYIE